MNLSKPGAAICMALFLAACGPGPDLRDVSKPVTTAPTDTSATFLGRKVEAFAPPQDGRSGIRLVTSGPEALAFRQILSERAERSIDAQYYIMHNDVTGHIFAGELLKAADRGVRVRLLLDDMYTAEYDDMMVALSRHPNISIRLFNPFRRDLWRPIDSLFEFGRINRRMHNKSMTFDNQVTLVGGRNIADEYFSADEDSNYDDLDLLATGPVVGEVSGIFDTYWNSPYAIPAETVIGQRKDTPSYAEARARLLALYDAAGDTAYGTAVGRDVRRQISDGNLNLSWVPAKAIADNPDKAAGASREILAAEILPLLTSARREVVIESAYFMPGPRGTELLASLARRGVHVVILTNSLDSNDVQMVHAHYARYRKTLLEAGVELWELRPDKERADRSMLQLGQSLSGLHSKAFSVDGRYLFIGSFNWDPRSVNINTEMGILVDSPKDARGAVRRLASNLPDTAYRLRLDAEGRIEWLEHQPGGGWIAYRQEPASSGWRRFVTGLYAFLPVAGQL